MPDIERSIYFYRVVMHDGEWRRADVLRALDGLQGDDQMMALGNDNYAWVMVDRIPRGRESGRLRLFRDRRSNLPGFSHDGAVADLPIPDGSGLVEPTHIVLGGDGLIAAEYNHFAPRIATQFAEFLRTKLDLDLSIQTYVQGSIVEQLDRLDYITLFESSLVPDPDLEDELRDAGPFGDAAVTLSQAGVGRRVALKLSSYRNDGDFSDNAKRFVRKMLPFAENGHGAKVLRVTGFDPVPNDIEVVDLLKQRLLRLVDFERPSERSKALNTNSAYRHIEEAIAEVRATDLANAALL